MIWKFINELVDVFLRPSKFTTLSVLLIASLSLLAVLYYFLIKRRPNRVKKKAFVTVSIIVSILFFAELLFVVTGVADSYHERNGEKRPVHIRYIVPEFYPYEPNSHLDLVKHEFIYSRSINSLGLADREWSLEKTGKMRIIALGDSFTEGDGVSYEYSWVQQAATLRPDIEWLNAGIRGSDPFYAHQLLQEKLLPYQPDLVVVSLHGQDLLQDFLMRGGITRFENKKKWVTIRELLYGYSRIARMIYHLAGYDELLNKIDDAAIDRIKNIYLPEMVMLYSKLAEKHRLKVHFIYTPMKGDLLSSKHQEYNLGEAVCAAAKEFPNISASDATACYKGYIASSGHKPDHFWWSIDGHHNKDGYAMKAHCIIQVLSLNERSN
jgi:hypothetical protein